MIDVYLCYAHADHNRAIQILEGLKEVGVNVWLDRDVPAGERWRDAIHQAIKEARVVVALFSPDFVGSEWARAEAQLALSESKLLPVKIRPVQLPLGFLNIQYSNLAKWNGDKSDLDWLYFVQAVTSRLKSLDGGPTPDTPGAPIVIEPGRKYKPAAGAQSIQLFVAHASADKPKLKPILEVLLDQGFKVWIDKPQGVGLSQEYEAKIALARIHFGSDWKEDIRKAIHRARIVLAFWSVDAVEGRREQFHYEVYQGMMQKKLHQCRIDNVDYEQIGMPYTFDHIANLATMKGREYNPEMDYLMQDMTNRKRGWFW